MYRRNIIFILTGILILGLVGCQQHPKTEKETKPTIRWVADRNPIRKEQIDIAEKQNADIKVKLDWGSVGMQKILTQIAGGVPPDIFMVYSLSDFLTLAQKGVLEDLTPYCKKYNVDSEDFWPSARPWIYYKDKIYGFPEVVTPVVLWYNKKLFREANIAYPTDEWTYKELLEAAQKLTKKDSSGRYIQFGIGFTGWWEHQMQFIWQNGGRLYSPDERRCIIDSAEAVEGIQFYYDLHFKYHVAPSLSETKTFGGATGSAVNLFVGERISMVWGGRPLTIYLREAKNVDWGIAPFPKGKHKKTFLGLHNNVIAKDGKNKDEAFRFLLSLVSKESQILLSNYGEAVPSRKSVALTKEFLFNPEYPDETDNQLWLNEMHGTQTEEISPYVSSIDVTRIWNEEFDKMMAELQTPEKTLSYIAKRVNILISENLDKR